MKTSKTLAWRRAALLVGCAVLTYPAALTAQVATPASATEPKKDETVILNPFEVNSSKDTGFVATSSLAGGRLATDIKDTPVAYSALTREFVDAVGVTDLQTALEWMPNVVSTMSTQGPGNNDISGQPIGNVTVRGVGSGSSSSRQQRNYFIYFAPMDEFDLERYDVGRGPNAILFGNGTFGGVSNALTKQASFDKRSASIEQKFGSWSYARSTIDVNTPINDKLAVRTAAVYFDRKGYLYKEFEKNRAVFLTGTYKVTKTTTLRVEGEYGDLYRTIPLANVNDRLSGWDGVTTFSGATALPANANAIGVQARTANYNVFVPASGRVINYQGDLTTEGGGITATTPIGPYTYGTTLPSNGFNADGTQMFYQIGITPHRFDRAIAGSNFRLPGKTFTTAGDDPIFQNHYKDFEATLDQQLGDFTLELAIDRNKTRQQTNTEEVRNVNDIFIELNRLRPDGSIDPWFLQPYSDTTIRKNPFQKEVQGYRGSLATQKDFGRWGKYLGSILGGYLNQLDNAQVYNLSLQQSPDHRQWGGTNNTAYSPITDLIKVRRLFYQTSRPISIPTTVEYVNPLTGVDKSVTPVWTVEDDRADSFAQAHDRYTYGMVALQAKYWEDKIVLLGAFRRDNFKAYYRNQLVAGDYPATWDGTYGIFRPNAPKDYTALTYTPKDALGNPTGTLREANIRPRGPTGDRLSQYANDRFKDDFSAPQQNQNQGTKNLGLILHPLPWFSPFFNYAETFNPPNPIQTLDSTFLPPTLAKGTDVGARFSALGGRITGSVDYYRSSEKNVAGSGFSIGNINNILEAQPVGSPPGSRNIRGEPDLPTQATDVQDRADQGYEFEMTGNFTRNWRGIFNFGVPRLYTQNGNQYSFKYLAQTTTVLKQIVVDAGGVIDPTTNVASADPNVPAASAPGQAQAVNNWNNMVTNVKGLTSTRSSSTASKSVNLYTDYTFHEGPAKGFRAGIGVQWRQARVIGNRGGDTIVDPNNPAAVISYPNGVHVNIRQPQADYPVTVNLEYARPLSDHHQVTFRIDVFNALNNQSILYTGTSLRPTNGDYTVLTRTAYPNSYALRTPISFRFGVKLDY